MALKCVATARPGRVFSARAVRNALERAFPIQRGVVFLVAAAVALYHFKKEFSSSKGDRYG